MISAPRLPSECKLHNDTPLLIILEEETELILPSRYEEIAPSLRVTNVTLKSHVIRNRAAQENTIIYSREETTRNYIYFHPQCHDYISFRKETRSKSFLKYKKIF